MTGEARNDKKKKYYNTCVLKEILMKHNIQYLKKLQN